MAHLHSTAILLGIKDPHIQLEGALQEDYYYQVRQFRPGASSRSIN